MSLYDEALTLLAMTPDSTPKSGTWTNNLADRGRVLFDDAELFVNWLTSVNSFAFPRLRDDPLALPVIAKWLRHLEMLPPVGESPYANKETLFDIYRIPVSTVLMQYSWYAQQIETVSPGRILEIGPGYGGLARILCTIKPREYTILDIPSSLFCSYIYLRLNFPDARCVWCTKVEDLTKPADFRFVPADFWRHLLPETFDMAINTCSLGEMLPEVRDNYMELIHATSRHFYSHNRYNDRAPPPDTAIPALVLDDRWETLFDEIEGVAQTDPETPASREQLLRRIA